jgi:hypothetical protein
MRMLMTHEYKILKCLVSQMYNRYVMEKKKGGKGIGKGDILLASTLARQVQTNKGHVTWAIVLYGISASIELNDACIKWYHPMHGTLIYLQPSVELSDETDAWYRRRKVKACLLPRILKSSQLCILDIPLSSPLGLSLELYRSSIFTQAGRNSSRRRSRVFGMYSGLQNGSG